jgi:predicted RNA-binding Zn-ribbon protein involved in translation (DUF1610 family)
MASPFLSSPTPHHRAGHTHSGSKQRPTFEVADILRAHLPDSLHEHSHPLHVHKVLSAIQNCRTAALGGHIDYCTDCGTLYNSYNSCRDRHCPKCQGLEKARWIEARKDELLPVPYFHTVFTLPHAINDWVGWNDKLIYDLLFASATDTTGKDIHVCPSCGGRLRRQRDLAPTIGPARGQDPPLACEAA